MSSTIDQPRFLTELGVEFSRLAAQESARCGRRRRPRRIRMAFVAAAATLAIVGGAAATTGVVPISRLLPGGPPPHGHDFAPDGATGSFNTALRRELAVLRRTRTPADSMGAAATYVSGSDLAPSSSLRIRPPAPPTNTPHATATRLPVWVVPNATGNASMQVLSPGATGPGSGVTADPQMLKQGFAYMTIDHDLFGLAVDGVRHVEVSLRGGAHVRLPVEGNVFGAHFDRGVASVRR